MEFLAFEGVLLEVVNGISELESLQPILDLVEQLVELKINEKEVRFALKSEPCFSGNEKDSSTNEKFTASSSPTNEKVQSIKLTDDDGLRVLLAKTCQWPQKPVRSKRKPYNGGDSQEQGKPHSERFC